MAVGCTASLQLSTLDIIQYTESKLSYTTFIQNVIYLINMNLIIKFIKIQSFRA